MNFDDLPPDYLRELVKWSPDFLQHCHRLSKRIYMETKTVKLEFYKDVPIKRYEYERYIRLNDIPFGCVRHSGSGFTCNLDSMSKRFLTSEESLDIRYYSDYTYTKITLSTVRSYFSSDKVCFNMSSKHFQVSYPNQRKHWKDETFSKIFNIDYEYNSYMSLKAIKMSEIFRDGDLRHDDGVCFDCYTIFIILSTRTNFSLELCRTQTRKYFDSSIKNFNCQIQRFMYVYINHLILGLDSIHNQFSCNGAYLDTYKILEMADEVRDTIMLLQ